MARPWLHRSTILLAACAFLSVFTGTAVTSNEERPFYSLGQSHLWVAAGVGILTIVVVIWIHAARERGWLRVLARMAVAIVAGQALLGFEPLPQPAVIRIAHAFLAQLFFPITVAIAVGTSGGWEHAPKPVQGGGALRALAKIVPVVVLAQVALGILFRHGAIDVMPHLLGAFVATFFVLGLALPAIYRPEHSSLRPAARVALAIVFVQVFLGMALLSMQSMDVDPVVVILVTMIHAATGALTLAAVVMMALQIARNASDATVKAVDRAIR